LYPLPFFRYHLNILLDHPLHVETPGGGSTANNFS
jgi:hypothetical protein